MQASTHPLAAAPLARPLASWAPSSMAYVWSGPNRTRSARRPGGAEMSYPRSPSPHQSSQAPADSTCCFSTALRGSAGAAASRSSTLIRMARLPQRKGGRVPAAIQRRVVLTERHGLGGLLKAEVDGDGASFSHRSAASAPKPVTSLGLRVNAGGSGAVWPMYAPTARYSTA